MRTPNVPAINIEQRGDKINGPWYMVSAVMCASKTVVLSIEPEVDGLWLIRHRADGHPDAASRTVTDTGLTLRAALSLAVEMLEVAWPIYHYQREDDAHKAGVKV